VSLRPGVLRIGDRVRFDGGEHTVVGLSGTAVRLAADGGGAVALVAAHLQAAGDFALLGGPQAVPLPPFGLLDTVPDKAGSLAHVPPAGPAPTGAGGADPVPGVASHGWSRSLLVGPVAFEAGGVRDQPGVPTLPGSGSPTGSAATNSSPASSTTSSPSKVSAATT
jgi:hypothetical protein